MAPFARPDCTLSFFVAGATAGAVATNPRLAGSAAGLLGMVQMLSASVTTFLIGALEGQSAMPLAVLMAATLALGFAAALLSAAARR